MRKLNPEFKLIQLIIVFILMGEHCSCTYTSPNRYSLRDHVRNSVSQSPDKAASQLVEYAAHHPQSTAGIVRTTEGCPVPSLTASLAVGQHGNVLLQDVFLINELASFARERIPERVVHAKGYGAFGVFHLLKDVSTLTKADFLNGPGKTTRVLCRFSLSTRSNGASDLTRDGRGFAVKFYTVDGIFDLARNTGGVFPINDPMLYGDLMRSLRPNPQTNLMDSNMRWDFGTHRPETILTTLFAHSDFGANGRVLNGLGVHAYLFRNKEGAISYVKFHLISQQSFRWFNQTELNLVGGQQPDYATRDLFNAIANKDYPKWTVKIQVMTLQQSVQYHVNPFDITKLWREEDFPLMTIGELILNENPQNYFVDIEQAAFNPANLVPGIEANPKDKMFAARMFAYRDAQQYRLGVNYAQLEVNRPKFPVRNYLRDGFMRPLPNGGGSPVYFPNSFHGPVVNGSMNMEGKFYVEGLVDRLDYQSINLDKSFRLARLYLYKDKSVEQRGRIVQNLGNSLAKAIKRVRDRAIRELFFRISEDFGRQVEFAMEQALASQ